MLDPEESAEKLQLVGIYLYLAKLETAPNIPLKVSEYGRFFKIQIGQDASTK